MDYFFECMRLTLVLTGKTDTSYITEGMDVYLKRIAHYIDFKLIVISEPKRRNLTIVEQKNAEGVQILKHAAADNYIVLLDENGVEMKSTEFAGFLNKRMVSGCRNLCFVVGGPYGFSDSVYAAAKEKISLSRMTFSHQLVRLIFAEQLYRAFSILSNEPYHHE